MVKQKKDKGHEGTDGRRGPKPERLQIEGEPEEALRKLLSTPSKRQAIEERDQAENEEAESS